MPALNFQKQFAEIVETGAKTLTIRAPRKRPIKYGDPLYLYTGMRTKVCRKLGEAVCTAAKHVCIWDDCIIIAGQRLRGRDADYRAREDGFATFADMAAWFREQHGLPFSGELIKWKLRTGNSDGN